MTRVDIDSNRRHADALLDLLVDAGPLTADECCKKLGWSRGRFTTALKTAREVVCPALGIAIPASTPQGGWRYEATTEWGPVEQGASHALGHVETRLRSLARDVDIILPHLDRGSVEWRRANFLAKHLGHLTGTLAEIAGEDDGQG
jgi:hypothetical protein